MKVKPFRHKLSAAGLVAQMRSDPHAPFSAMIEVADRCNEVCVHCYQIQGQKGELSLDEWKRIIDELAEMGVLFLTISGGEATLRKDFLDIVAYAREKAFAVKLYTNGLSMTDALAASLADLAVQEVQISLYSHRAEVHDWVTRVPGSWQKTVDGAKALIARGVHVVLKSPLMSFNADEYREYIDFVTSVGADFSLDPQLDYREDGDRSTQRLQMDDRTYLKVLSDPILGRERSGTPKKSLDRSVCGACSGNVHIEANGEMRPCTLLNVPVGNAVEDGVRKAWTENADAAMIRELTWRDLHGCRDCDLQPYCGRCFANAQTETGDATAPYASACARAKLGWERAHGAPPEVQATAGRDPKVGPYREVEPGVFRTMVDVRTAEDEERAGAFGWVRREPGEQVSGETIRPGGLVQIRRPGAKRARTERVPGSDRQGPSTATSRSPRD